MHEKLILILLHCATTTKEWGGKCEQIDKRQKQKGGCDVQQIPF